MDLFEEYGLTRVINACGKMTHLAGAIVEYYREKKEDAFARAIRLEKKKYSWDRMAGAIEQFLSERESPNRSTGVGHRTIRAE